MMSYGTKLVIILISYHWEKCRTYDHVSYLSFSFPCLGLFFKYLFQSSFFSQNFVVYLCNLLFLWICSLFFQESSKSSKSSKTRKFGKTSSQGRSRGRAGQGRAGQDGGGHAGEADGAGQHGQCYTRKAGAGAGAGASVCACKSVRQKLNFINISDVKTQPSNYIKLKEGKAKPGHVKWWSPLFLLGGASSFPLSLWVVLLSYRPLEWCCFLLPLVGGGAVSQYFLMKCNSVAWIQLTSIKWHGVVPVPAPPLVGGAAFLLLLLSPLITRGGAAFRPSPFGWHYSFPSFLESPFCFSFSLELVPLWGLGASFIVSFRLFSYFIMCVVFFVSSFFYIFLFCFVLHFSVLFSFYFSFHFLFMLLIFDIICMFLFIFWQRRREVEARATHLPENVELSGVRHLGTISGKNGTLKSGKTKGGGTKGKNDNDRFMLRIASGNCWRAERSRLLSRSTWVLRIPQIFSFWQFRVQTVATAMNATGCVQTRPRRTHIRALFLAAHATCDYTLGSRAWRFCVCLEKSFHLWSCLCWMFPSTPLAPVFSRLRPGVDRLATWPIRLQTHFCKLVAIPHSLRVTRTPLPQRREEKSSMRRLEAILQVVGPRLLATLKCAGDSALHEWFREKPLWHTNVPKQLKTKVLTLKKHGKDTVLFVVSEAVKW